MGDLHRDLSSPTNTRSLKNQLPLNLVGNIAYFLVNIIIGLLLVPYFISTLGVAAYGIIPLATSITGYVAIVITSLNSSVSRFLTVDLQKGDYAAANRTFNTSFFGLSAIIALMIPVIIIISIYIPLVFNIPAGESSDVTFLFLGVCTAFLIRSWNGNFTVQLFACNRLDLQNVVNIVTLVSQTILIVIFFTLFGPNLVFIGEAYIFGAIIASSIAIVLAKRVCPHLSISIHSFDRSRVRDLCGMGGWVVVNQIGTLLFIQIDLIVVNLLFGATSAGEYAIALQWVVLLRSISGVLSGVLTPVVLTFYAKRQTEALIQITRSAVKLMGLAMALPIGLVCGFASQLLTVWVGPEFSFLAPLMIILTVHLVINLAVLPIFSINIAYNQVRFPGIVSLLMGLGNFALAIILSVYTNWGYYGVAVAGAIVLTLKNTFFTPWYATRVLNINVHTFTRSMIPGIGAVLFIGIFAIIIRFFFPLNTLVGLVAAGTIITIFYLGILWIVGLSKSERNLLTTYLPKRIRECADAIPCYLDNN